MGKTALPTRDGFVHHLIIATRWMDNDVYGHVNNATYDSYFDAIIDTYLIAEGGSTSNEGAVIGLAVATGCRFARAVSFPELVDARLRVARLGHSSVTHEVGLFTDGHEVAAAFGHFVHVFVERASRRPTPIAGRMREARLKIAVG